MDGRVQKGVDQGYVLRFSVHDKKVKFPKSEVSHNSHFTPSCETRDAFDIPVRLRVLPSAAAKRWRFSRTP